MNTPYNIKLLVGQLAIILLVLGTSALAYLNYTYGSYKYAIPLTFWALIIIILGFWTKVNPKKAFLFLLIFYIGSVIIKNILIGGEYILPFLFHCYFATSMLIGMYSGKVKVQHLNGS